MGLRTSQPTPPSSVRSYAVESVNFSGDGTLLAVGCNSRGLAIYETGTWQEMCLLDAANGKVGCVQFAPHVEQLLASFGEDIIVHQKATSGLASWFGSPWKATATIKNSRFSTSIDFASSGRIVAIGGYSGDIAVYDASSWHQLHKIPVMKGVRWIPALSFSPDDALLAVGCSTGELKLIETSSWTVQTSIQTGDKDAWVMSVAFAADGQLIAAGCQHGKVVIVEKVETTAVAFFVGGWRELTVLQPNEKGWITSLKFSPDGRWLAMASSYPNCWLVFATDSWLNKSSKAEDALCIEFSPDGNMLVVGGLYGQVRIYRAPSWEELVVLGKVDDKVKTTLPHSSGNSVPGPVSSHFDGCLRGGASQQDELQIPVSAAEIISIRRPTSTGNRNNISDAVFTRPNAEPSATQGIDLQKGLRSLESHLTLIASSVATSMRSAPGRELEKSGVPTIPFALIKDMCGELSQRNELGKGAFGTVYRGVMKGTGGDVQIAVKLRRRGADTISMADLQEEASTMAICRHPNIVPLLAISSDEDFCIVMPLMPDGSLEHLLQDVSRLRRCGSGQRIGYARDMFNGLSYLHAPSWSKPAVIHCDIKPENLLLEGPTARVGDVGVSKCMSFWLKAAKQIGTPAFSDPGYAETSQLTSASDMYSAGIVAFQMLTGASTIQVEEAFTAANDCVQRWEQQRKLMRPGLSSDFRAEWPGSVADVLYALAVDCTDLSAIRRPTADNAHDCLQRLLSDGPSGPPTAAQLAESGPKVCVVCLGAPRQGLLRPCGHYVVCWTCAELIVAQGQRCPVCRSSVIRFEGGHSSQTYAGEA